MNGRCVLIKGFAASDWCKECIAAVLGVNRDEVWHVKPKKQQENDWLYDLRVWMGFPVMSVTVEVFGIATIDDSTREAIERIIEGQFKGQNIHVCVTLASLD